MADHLPPPLTPADCDLEGFEFMPVEVRRLLKSDTWSLGNGDERAAAVSLWFESWHQTPAGSLPTDERLLARLADSEKWKRVKPQALRGWILCSDNRLYHPVVAEKVLEAWIERLVAAISGAAGNAKRWQITIDIERDLGRLRHSVALLGDLSPRSKTLRKPGLLKLLASKPNASPAESGGDHGPESGGDASKTSGADRNREGQGEGQGFLNTGDKDAPANPRESAPTVAGSVCLAVRKAGIASVNPSDPRLLALLERGVTVDTFVGAVPATVGKRNAWAYLLGVVEGQLRDAAAIGNAPKAQPRTAARHEQRADTIAALTGQNRKANHDQPEPAIDVASRVVDR